MDEHKIVFKATFELRVICLAHRGLASVEINSELNVRDHIIATG